MRIDRSTYSEYFTKHNTPSWNCSACNKGKIYLNIEDLLIIETNKSVEEREEVDWEPFWLRQHFMGKINCNNSRCKELYSIAGEISIIGDQDEKYGLVYTDCYYPRYVFPIIKLFDPPENTPPDVEDTLLNSFKLYWFDKSACANSIRSTVEMILTDKKIVRTELSRNNKRKSLSLHRRIEIFENKSPDVSHHLMAIKWIGNAGSHVEEVYSEDLLDAFDLLSYALNKLYGSHDKEIKSITRKINKRKKPLN